MKGWHATAVVDPRAEIADGVEIGPYCTVGPGVRIGAGTRLVSHVAIDGEVDLGAHNLLYPFVAIGYPAQVRSGLSGPARLTIGSHNVFREQVTLHTGTPGGDRMTRIGSHGLFMVGTHVAHDCTVGDQVVLANGAQVGGHAVIGNFAQVGALTGVHQHVRIGAYAFIGGCSAVEKHVIPYGLAIGNRAGLRGLNIIGLQRAGFGKAEIDNLRKAYGLLFSGDELFWKQVGNLDAELQESPGVAEIVRFCRGIEKVSELARRGMCLPRNGRP